MTKSTVRKSTTATPSTRPSLNRKVTPRDRASRGAELAKGLRIKIDEQWYEVTVGQVDSRMARELRQHTGMGVLQLIAAMATSPDIDLIAAFVWLSRRITGEVVAFDEVVVTYDQMLAEGFDMDLPEGADNPEI